MAAYNSSGVVNQQFVSALGVNRRDVYRELYHRDPETSFFNLMRDMSAMSGVSQQKAEHYEKGSIFSKMSVGPAGSVVNGDGTLTFSVPASEVNAGRIYALVGNLVEFAPSGSQQGRINAVNGASVTIAPYLRDSSNNPVPLTAVPAGTSVFIFSNGHADGSDQPGSRRQTPDLFTAYTQIFKNDFRVTGSAETSEAEFSYKGQACYALVGEADEAARHLAEIDNAFLFGKGGQGVDENGDPVFMTKGLLQHARDRGINRTGGFTAITDFDAMCRVLNKLRAPSEYALLSGINNEIDLNNLFREAKYYEGINYTMAGGKQNAEALGFQSYRVNSYSFHGNRLDAFNHNLLAGQDGFSYPSTTVGMPLQKVRDPKTGEDSLQVSIRNKEFSGINRWHEVWETGANARANKTTVDERRVHYKTEAMLQVKGADLLYLNVKS